MAFDAVSSWTDYAPTTCTWAHTIATGAVLLVSVAKSADTNNRTVSSVTYNGVALTELKTLGDDSGANIVFIGLYILHNPDAGTHNIVVTLSGAPGESVACFGMSYTGIVATSAAASHRTVYHGGAGSGGHDTTVTDSQNGDTVVACVINYVGSGHVASATGTGRGSVVNIKWVSQECAVEDVTATGASQVMAWTNDACCSTVAVALIPTGGGGGATIYPIWRSIGSGVGIGIQ